jgi:PAS domain S-box-containing protein
MKSGKKILVLLFFISQVVSVQAQENGGQVLVLHSYHRGLEWTDSIMQGIEAEFARQTIRPEIHVEYMDTKRHLPATVFPALHDLYVKKYGKTPPDLIIVSDDNAYEFILAFRDELFPGVPVVFCGVNYFDPARLAGSQGITGIVEGMDILGTLEAALHLHPETERIFVVNDTTTTGQANKKVVKEIIPRFSERIEFNFLETLSMEALQGELQALPPKSLVLLLSFNRDSAGRTFTYKEAIRQIAPHSKAPMYGVWEFYLGRGIVGGKLTRGVDHGRTVATMGLSILRGEATENIPVVLEGINSFMFDYPVLRKLGIDIEQLPPGSIIVNKPVSFYHRNKRMVLAVGGVIVALTLLALFLTLNIIKRKRAEEHLRESKEKFQLLLNSTAEAIYGVDTNGKCTFCNPACVELLGYVGETELLGKNMHKLIHHHRRDRTIYSEEECQIYMAFREGQGVHVDDEIFWRKNGSYFDAEYSAFPIFKDENVVGSVVTFHDITERKKVQADLIESKKLAEQASVAKDEFLAAVSHEVRTPMTVFMGAIEHLLEIEKDPECREVIDLANLSSKRLYALLNEVLDHSMIEAHHMEINDEVFNLRECLREAVEMMKERAQKKGLILRLEVAPSVPEEKSGDPYRLGQIILNLIGNAIKFTDKGEVTVKVESYDDFLEFSVLDTGIGISEDKVEEIFESFKQVDSSSTRKHGGVGLGLAISKGLAELLGGSISVYSELGKGSVFSLRLPIQNTAPRKE